MGGRDRVGGVLTICDTRNNRLAVLSILTLQQLLGWSQFDQIRTDIKWQLFCQFCITPRLSKLCSGYRSISSMQVHLYPDLKSRSYAATNSRGFEVQTRHFICRFWNLKP